jgi:hypothetical protein
VGLSFGGGSSSGTSSSNTSQNQSNVYAPGQTSLQSQLGGTLANDLTTASEGTLSPGVTASETAADNQTNQTAGGLTDRVNAALAARGFGPSGTTGKTTLQGELARESQIGNNANAATVQQQTLNQSNLLAALNYAFTSLGSTGGSSSSGYSSGSDSNWGANASAAFGFG